MDNSRTVGTTGFGDDSVRLEAVFDWIEFTVHDLSVSEVINIILKLPPGEFMEIKRGRYGYKEQLKWNTSTLFILFNSKAGSDSSGVHVIFTGQACRHYEKISSLMGVLDRVERSLHRYNYTRIDLAIDDETDTILNFDRFFEYSDKTWASSSWYKFSLMKEQRLADGVVLGRTLYYGSRSSKLFMRVYDKKLESIKRAKVSESRKNELLKEHHEWTRMELVFRDERAQLLAQYLTSGEDLSRLLLGVLNKYIRFVEPIPNSNDDRKRRWPTAKWWEKVIENVGKVSLTTKKADKSIEDMQNWVVKQIAPTLAAISTATEGDTDWLYNAIINGSSRLKTKHHQAIEQFKKESQVKDAERQIRDDEMRENIERLTEIAQKNNDSL